MVRALIVPTVAWRTVIAKTVLQDWVIEQGRRIVGSNTLGVDYEPNLLNAFELPISECTGLELIFTSGMGASDRD